MPRKRTRTEMEASEPPEEKQELSLLQRIRNMWEFAATMQYIFIFGKAVRIDEDFDIEDFETECLKPGYSEKLEEIGLTLLKWISSHRGLNYDIWDEYTRRQYQAKAPHRNPYGDEEEPMKFRSFDIFQKIRVLHQLTIWTFWNPDRLRERMPEHQRESDQLEWRIEELGYDRDERQYYVLDDNRLYRRTEPPLPPAPKAKPKASSKKAQAARRKANKRRRIEDSEDREAEENGTDSPDDITQDNADVPSATDDTFGGYQWELLAITLNDYNDFIESIKKSKDPNEKILRQRIIEEVVPIIEAAEERQKRKIERRERELMVMEKMAGAKRSSRLADKQEREKREIEVAEAERKRQADLVAAHREQEKQDQMDRDRKSRMMTREQRIKDREYKRLLMEEELARDAEEQKKIEEGQARGSERQLKERIEKNKKQLEDLKDEEEWTFDCSGCGAYGRNLDDGSHSVACERCNVWQHSKCLGISKAAADKDNFHFICRDCRQKEEDAKKPKISLKFKVRSSSSPAPPSPAHPPRSPQMAQFVVEIPKTAAPRPSSQGSITNGYRPSPSPSAPHTGPSPHFQAPVQQQAHHQISSHYRHPAGAQQYNSPPALPLSASSAPSNTANGYEARPGSSGQPLPPNAYYASTPNGQPQQRQQYGNSPPYYNGIHHQYQNFSVAPRPTSSNGSSRPSSSNGQPNGQTPSVARMPSPVVNRPLISPTQGNFDVSGVVAGVPQKSTPPQQSTATLQVNGTPHGQSHPSYNNGTPSLTPNAGSNATPLHQHLSGLSPTKHRTSMSPPLPPPSNVPMKMSMSPHQPVMPSARSVSGTPIFPPAETLAPSPQQLSKSPMPTPSKQPTAAEIGVEELRRTSQAIEGAIVTEAHDGGERS